MKKSLLFLLLASCVGDIKDPEVEIVGSLSNIQTCPKEVTVGFEQMTGSCAIERFHITVNFETKRSNCVGYITEAPSYNCEHVLDLTCENIGRVMGWVNMESSEELTGVAQVKMEAGGCVGLYDAYLRDSP